MVVSLECLLKILKAVSLVFALLCFIIGLLMWSDPVFEDIDRMVEVDTGNAENPSMFVTWLTFFAAFACIVIGIGWTGLRHSVGVGKQEAIPYLSVFTTLALVVAALFGITACASAQFVNAMEPTIQRQTIEFCNASFHPIFVERLNCTNQVTPVGNCGEFCDERINRLRQLGGCRFLQHMCTFMTFTPDASCFTSQENVSQMLWKNDIVVQKECEHLCAIDVACSGYAYNDRRECFLDATVPPANTENLGWAHVSRAGAVFDHACYRKAEPAILTRIHKYITTTTISAALAGTLFMITGLASTIHIYTLVTKHKGKKGIHMICSKMFCPCCFMRRGRRKEFLVVDQGDADD